jgi:hypothetical protein
MPNYDIVSVSGGVSVVLNTVTGNGVPKLYQGGWGQEFIYGLAGQLPSTLDGWGTIDDLYPSGSTTSIIALCQLLSDVTNNALSTVATFRASTQGGQANTRVHNGLTWGTAVNLVSGLVPSDAIGDDSMGTIAGALISNSHIGAESRVIKGLTSWADSDSGIPQSGATSGVTQIEIGV